MKLKSALKAGHDPAGPENSEPARNHAECPSAKPGITRILVPTDYSPCSVRALEHAVTLANAFEATIILLHVVEPAISSIESMTAPADREEQLQAHLNAERERLVELHRKRIGPHVTGETLVRIGRAWSEISDTAKALGADLIVLGAQGAGCLRQSLLGSTAEGVVRHARCPVLTVPQTAP